MAGPPVPGRPRLSTQDYTLGQDYGWLQRFGEGTERTRGAAVNLQNRGWNLGGQADAVQGRATPQTNFNSAQMSLGAAGQTGRSQTGAADWLASFAQGPQGPSAAQAQLQQGANQAMGQNLALARSGSGFGESANALASAQRANADTMASASNQAAQLRAQEDQAFRAQQLQAMTGAADIYGQARGADLATAGQQADMSQFMTDAELRAQQMRDAQQLGLGAQGIEATNLGIQGSLAAQGLGLDAAQAELDARIARDQTNANLYGTEADVFRTRSERDLELAEQRRRNRQEGAGYIAQGAAAVAGLLSDRRTKRRGRRVEDELDAAYAALEGDD